MMKTREERANSKTKVSLCIVKAQAEASQSKIVLKRSLQENGEWGEHEDERNRLFDGGYDGAWSFDYG
jgi:hypothetical protein